MEILLIHQCIYVQVFLRIKNEDTNKIKKKNKLNDYRKIINRKITSITRNKTNNISFRETYKSKDYSIEKNKKHNASCNLINGNYDIKSENKEEKQNKTPKKIIISNKTQNLCDFLRKSKNKFLVTKIINNVNQLNIKK